MSHILRPILVGNGVEVNTGGDLLLPYGVSRTADLWRAMLFCVGAQVPVTPSGWFLADSISSAGHSLYLYDRILRATGNEFGGSQNFVIPAGNLPNMGVIFNYRNVRLGDYFESLSQNSAAGAGPTTIAGPTVVATGKARLACCYSGSNGIGAQTAIVGNTGGTWVTKYDEVSGLGYTFSSQDAALTESGTVTGGTMTMPGTLIRQLGQALIGTSQLQTTAGFTLPTDVNSFQYVTAPLEGARIGDTYTFSRYNGYGTPVDTTSCVEVFCNADDIITAKFITTNPLGFDVGEEWILALGLPEN